MVTFTKTPRECSGFPLSTIPNLTYKDERLVDVMNWHHLLTTAEDISKSSGWSLRTFWEHVERCDLELASAALGGVVDAWLNVRTDGEVFIDREAAR